MANTTDNPTPEVPGNQAIPVIQDRLAENRSISYAQSFDSALKSTVIRSIEWMTGKLTILRLYRKFMRAGHGHDERFWGAVLDTLGIDITTPPEQFARIPKEGPLVVVGNHPHGLIDGIVFAYLLNQVRQDYKVLTRALLTNINEYAGSFMISVPFPHQEDAQERMIEMRAQSMAHLAEGGAIALFPSGVVASSETLFGPAVEQEWSVFTAKMIRKSGATVLPIRFPGANSRAYQIANKLSPTVRQGLLLHEIVHAANKPQGPIIGHPIAAEEAQDRLSDPRGFMAWLREHTLSLED